jgi:hypothetical protein
LAQGGRNNRRPARIRRIDRIKKESSMPAPRGRFVWYELMTSDSKAAEAFYTHVVGWGARDAGMAQPYTLFTLGASADARDQAGLMDIPPEAKSAGAKPSWTGYVLVDDVDGDARRITEAGGRTCVPGTDIPGIGRFAVVNDPQGAAFALFKPASGDPPAEPPAMGTPGTVGWHELHAEDLDSAVNFYTTTFGWALDEPMDMGPAGKYQIFRTGADQAGGIVRKMAQEPAPYWNYYFNVEEIESAIARVRERGGQVLNGPMQVPGGTWIANCLDPQGALFSLAAMNKAV